jgi:hypothetical protein
MATATMITTGQRVKSHTMTTIKRGRAGADINSSSVVGVATEAISEAAAGDLTKVDSSGAEASSLEATSSLEVASVDDPSAPIRVSVAGSMAAEAEEVATSSTP